MKILFADDDPLTRDAVRAILEAEGHQVIEASDGIQADERFSKLRPDLVLLDIMMPGASGYEVCRRIRRIDSKVPVMFLSAKSEEIDVVLGLELGADDFLRKPFGKHELLARIRAVLRRRGQPATAQGSDADFRFGPWTVHPKRLAASGGDVEIALTVREIAILHLLAHRRGELVTRDELLNSCWGMEYYPESRTLDQHILNLRKKVEADPSRPALIETIRGSGYRHPDGVGGSPAD